MAIQNTPFTGRYCAVKTGATTIRGVGNWSISFVARSIDASDFTTIWDKQLSGTVGWTASVGGYFDGSTDSTGMVVTLMKNAFQGTKLQDVRFYLNTATSYFFMPQYTTAGYSTETTDAGCYFSNVNITAEKADVVRATFDVLGYGPIAIFGGTSLVVMEAT